MGPDEELATGQHANDTESYNRGPTFSTNDERQSHGEDTRAMQYSRTVPARMLKRFGLPSSPAFIKIGEHEADALFGTKDEQANVIKEHARSQSQPSDLAVTDNNSPSRNEARQNQPTQRLKGLFSALSMRDLSAARRVFSEPNVTQGTLPMATDTKQPLSLTNEAEPESEGEGESEDLSELLFSPVLSPKQDNLIERLASPMRLSTGGRLLLQDSLTRATVLESEPRDDDDLPQRTDSDSLPHNTLREPDDEPDSPNAGRDIFNLSFERSFLPPDLSNDPLARKTTVATPMLSSLQEETSEGQDGLLEEDHHRRSPVTPAPNAGFRPHLHERTVSGMSDLSDLINSPMLENNPEPKQLPNLDSLSYGEPPQTVYKNVKTPMTTRAYIKDMPTDTTITRRVEEFKIPAESLLALQPAIDELRTQGQAKNGNKVNLKESSLLIDNLTKENFGLKLKVLFMEKHLAKETDLDKAALTEDNIQLSARALELVHQLRAKQRTIKDLELEVAVMEAKDRKDAVENIHENVISDAASESGYRYDTQVGHIQQSLDEERCRADSAESEVTRLKGMLDVLSITDGTLPVGSEAGHQESIADLHRVIKNLEADLQGTSLAHQADVDLLERELGERNEELADLRLACRESTQRLKDYEVVFEEEEQYRISAESERIQLEKYIEARHSEIDNLRHDLRQLESFSPDTQEQRLSASVKEAITVRLDDLETRYKASEEDWQEHCADLQKRIDDLLHQKNYLSEDIEKLQRRVAAQNERAKAMNETLLRTESERDELAMRLQQHINPLTDLRGNATSEQNIQQALDQSRGKIMAIESHLEEAQNANAGLLQNSVDTQNEICDLRDRLDLKEQQTEDLHGLIRELETEISTVHEQLVAIEEDLKRESGTCDDLTEENVQKDRQLQELQDDLSRSDAILRAQEQRSEDAIKKLDDIQTLLEEGLGIRQQPSSNITQFVEGLVQGIQQERHQMKLQMQDIERELRRSLSQSRDPHVRPHSTLRTDSFKRKRPDANFEGIDGEISNLQNMLAKEQNAIAVAHARFSKEIYTRDSLLKELMALIRESLDDNGSRSLQPAEDIEQFGDIISNMLAALISRMNARERDVGQFVQEMSERYTDLEEALELRSNRIANLESRLQRLMVALPESASKEPIPNGQSDRRGESVSQWIDTASRDGRIAEHKPGFDPNDPQYLYGIIRHLEGEVKRVQELRVQSNVEYHERLAEVRGEPRKARDSRFLQRQERIGGTQTSMSQRMIGH